MLLSVVHRVFNTFIQCWIINHFVPMSFWELHAAYYSIVRALGSPLAHSNVLILCTAPCGMLGSQWPQRSFDQPLLALSHHHGHRAVR